MDKCNCQYGACGVDWSKLGSGLRPHEPYCNAIKYVNGKR